MPLDLPPDTGGYPSFIFMLIYLSVYFLVELAIKRIFKFKFPTTFAELYRNKKDVQYFAFVMGILITITTTPFCITALVTSDHRNSQDYTTMSTSGHICIASRSVLWISELNRLDHATGYILHHLSSLGFLVWHLEKQLPLQILYGFYSSLATEFFSDIRCLLDIHGIKPATSILAYRIQFINLILIVVLRLPPIVYTATFFQYWSIDGHVFWINAACLLFYSWFITSFIPPALKRLEIFKVSSESQAYMRICQKYDVSIYSIFFSVASFFAAMVSSTIYLNFSEQPMAGNKQVFLTLQLLLTGLAGLIGARLPSIIASGHVSTLFSSKFFEKTSLWLQGGLAAMVLSIAASSLVQRSTLLMAFWISLPLSEAIGRIGCHFAGCCGHRKRKGSVQLRSAALNAVLGMAVLTALIFGKIGLEQMVGVAITCNALIRLGLRPNAFAALQLAASVPYTSYSWIHQQGLRETRYEFAGQEARRRVRLLDALSIAVLAAAAVAAGVFVQVCGGLAIRPLVNVAEAKEE